jgi:hypothetical protein
VENANFGSQATGIYNLVESEIGVGDANVAHDSNVHIGAFSGPIPDAWRFDDTGCQTGSQINIASSALSKACPLLKGPAPLPITNFFVDPGTGEADIRLSVAYDTFTPLGTTRYTLWQVQFNHSFSSAGPTPPDQSTCGGADLCENLNLTYAFLLTTANTHDNLTSCDTDPAYPAGVFPGPSPAGFATWNGGCHPVAVQPSTWGHLKGLYH